MKYLWAYLLCLSLPAIGQPGRLPRTFKQPDFYIQFPVGWLLDTVEVADPTRFFLYAPAQSAAADTIRENVNLISFRAETEGASLTEIERMSEAELKKQFSELRVLERKQAEKAGVPYFKLVYTATLGSMRLYYIQRFYLYRQTVYVLTFTTSQTESNSYKNLGEDILNSFNIKQL